MRTADGLGLSDSAHDRPHGRTDGTEALLRRGLEFGNNSGGVGLAHFILLGVVRDSNEVAVPLSPGGHDIRDVGGNPSGLGLLMTYDRVMVPDCVLTRQGRGEVSGKASGHTLGSGFFRDDAHDFVFCVVVGFGTETLSPGLNAAETKSPGLNGTETLSPELTTPTTLRMSSAVQVSTPTSSLQTKSGLAMPITRIKADAKKASGCDQMATDAAVALAAVMELFVEEVSRRAQEHRRKGHSSIAPEVVVDVVTSDPDFAAILGENPVFITGAKKPSTRKAEEGTEEEPKPKKERKRPAVDGEPKKEKKRKVVKTVEEGA